MNENLKYHFKVKCSGEIHIIGITKTGDLFFSHPDFDPEKAYIELMKLGNPSWHYDFAKSPCLAYCRHLQSLRYEKPTDEKYKDRMENYIKQIGEHFNKDINYLGNGNSYMGIVLCNAGYSGL